MKLPSKAREGRGQGLGGYRGLCGTLRAKLLSTVLSIWCSACHPEPAINLHTFGTMWFSEFRKLLRISHGSKCTGLSFSGGLKPHEKASTKAGRNLFSQKRMSDSPSPQDVLSPSAYGFKMTAQKHHHETKLTAKEREEEEREESSVVSRNATKESKQASISEELEDRLHKINALRVTNQGASQRTTTSLRIWNEEHFACQGQADHWERARSAGDLC